jgi:hypothetical protein
VWFAERLTTIFLPAQLQSGRVNSWICDLARCGLGVTTQPITAHILDDYLLPRWGEKVRIGY